MKITIGIPVFNCETWVGTAIESALEQTWPDKEIIVVDDGSTDGTTGICQSFGTRIRFVRQSNRGGNAARNQIHQRSLGDWIQFLDSDDYLKPDKIRSQIEALPNLGDADVLCSATVEQLWVDGRFVKETVLPLDQDGDWISLWLKWSMPQTGGCLWRKEALRKIGGWNEQTKSSQEYELYFRALQNGLRFRTAGQPLAVYRIWSESTVCRRDRKSVAFGITDLIHSFLSWLEQQDKVTSNHRRIAAQRFFELARTMAREDVSAAAQYYRERKNEGLIEPEGAAAPWKYRLALSCFGFAAAEHLARLLRQ